VSTKAKTVAAKSKAAKAVIAKPASKVGIKPAAKPVAGKSVVKSSKQVTSKKPVVKPVIKTATKLKVTTKETTKAASKPIVKPSPKTLVKTVAKSKPAVKAKPLKSQANVKPASKKSTVTSQPKTKAAKPLAPPVKSPIQTISKSKSPAKSAVKPIDKVSIKPAPILKTSTSALSSAAPLVSTSAPKVVPATVVAPVKPRVSSRLAQLTVPSMAQSVASTAAKSSFTQSEQVTLIVSPLPSSIKKDPKLANNWKTKPAEQLTDAELIAMPESEYMNSKQLSAFRHRLQLLKEDMLANAGETTEHLREDTVVVPDPADRATIEEEHALELRTRDRERKLLKKIEQSITLIDAGEYGYCDETGEPIGVGRLLARPTATLSLEAQQRRELKQKMFGD